MPSLPNASLVTAPPALPSVLRRTMILLAPLWASATGRICPSDDVKADRPPATRKAVCRRDAVSRAEACGTPYPAGLCRRIRSRDLQPVARPPEGYCARWMSHRLSAGGKMSRSRCKFRELTLRKASRRPKTRPLPEYLRGFPRSQTSGHAERVSNKGEAHSRRPRGV